MFRRPKVLMFFADYGSGTKRNREYEKLAIFGDLRQRRGAELKVYSAVEAKCPGFFKEHEDDILDRTQPISNKCDADCIHVSWGGFLHTWVFGRRIAEMSWVIRCHQ